MGEGECVDSFKREVKRLIDSGMLLRKKDEFDFKLVVDEPKGLILNKSSEYAKEFKSYLSNEGFKGKKEETYLFRNDVLGKSTQIWSEWL